MKVDDELQELKRKHPNHCKTLQVTGILYFLNSVTTPKRGGMAGLRPQV